MPFQNGYRGAANGSVQTGYTDQPGAGIPGMQAYASDSLLADSILIGEANGIAAGKGVVYGAGDTSPATLQSPNSVANLPGVGTVEADFKGIVLFDEAMNSDENGVPGWAQGRVSRIMRPERAGGRCYVKTVDAVLLTDTVNLVIVAPADESYEVGEFSPSALGGGAAGTSIVLTNARWETAALANSVAVVELIGYSAPLES